MTSLLDSWKLCVLSFSLSFTFHVSKDDTLINSTIATLSTQRSSLTALSSLSKVVVIQIALEFYQRENHWWKQGRLSGFQLSSSNGHLCHVIDAII